MQRIAINTGGGDAPGLNAVIRATVLAATNRGNPLEWECPQGGSSELGWMITGDLYSGGGAFSITGLPMAGVDFVFRTLIVGSRMN